LKKFVVKENDSIVRHLALAFAIAVAFYVVSFAWIEHRRTFRGPWEVAFQSDAAGRPSVTILEPALSITQTLAFAWTNVPPNMNVTQRFTDATNEIPFGKVLFQDPTFLPGTLTLELFGHEVEALPRVLVVDKKEIAWSPNGRVDVARHN
jgi:hypothetical protein